MKKNNTVIKNDKLDDDIKGIAYLYKKNIILIINSNVSDDDIVTKLINKLNLSVSKLVKL